MKASYRVSRHFLSRQVNNVKQQKIKNSVSENKTKIKNSMQNLKSKSSK